MNTHLMAKIALSLFLWIILMLIIWMIDMLGIEIKIILSIAAFFLCGYIGHRVIPKITGPIIKKYK